ncbi:uncharacterized protein LOC133663674 [Entelurus aequoreus]|uniref:uncharacterized protein LOC133663674 n=1 Tax=Entelurus aequoreus TaxID=161455 RepID=UPI002B1E7C79|nr:uncharacterized protein LOC133663674 [Entelurus aequoreus]
MRGSRRAVALPSTSDLTGTCLTSGGSKQSQKSHQCKSSNSNTQMTAQLWPTHRKRCKLPSQPLQVLMADWASLSTWQKPSIDREVQNRIKQASASFGRLRGRVFQNKDLKLHTKVAVYLAVVMTTLLYSCEAWTLYSRHLRMLEAFHIRCLQCILGISWKDRVPHTEILCKTNCTSVEATVTQHQLRWLGHVIRMPEERLPRKVLYGQLHLGHRLAGGPKKRYKDQMKTVMKKCGLNPTQLEDTAVQRSTWRQLLQLGVHKLEEDRSGQRARKRQRRHEAIATPAPPVSAFTCSVCGRSCGSRIGLFSHMRTHKT